MANVSALWRLVSSGSLAASSTAGTPPGRGSTGANFKDFLRPIQLFIHFETFMNFLQVWDQDMCEMYNTTVIPHILSSSHLAIIILIKSQHLSRLVARPQQSKVRPLTSAGFLTESL